MKELVTPALLSVLLVAFLGVNGWWAVQWAETNRAVMANRIAIAKIESTRFTEADGARSLLEVWSEIASQKEQIAALQRGIEEILRERG